MINQEFFDMIKLINDNLENYFKWNYTTELEFLLAKLSKLTEEVWELNSEVQKKYFPSKNKTFSQENLEHEFADVLICLALLADTMWVDLNTAIENKFNIIKNRWWV